MDYSAPIPRYHLYGEDGPVEDFDFFHIETISARSQSLGWSLDVHSHAHLYQILLITAGEGALNQDGGQRQLAPGEAVYVPAGAVHGWTFSPGTQGFVVSFTGDYLAGGSPDLSQAGFAALKCASPEVNALDPASLRRLTFALAEMAEEAGGGAGRRAVFRSLLSFCLVLLFDQPGTSGQQEPASGFSLVKFKGLLEQNYRTQRSADFYAEAMGMSVPRLNRYCRLFLDRTVSQAVRDRLILEAKRLLSFSSQSVQEIAFALGYDDPAYFSRMFAKEAGLPPLDFRNSQPGPRSNG